MVIAYRLISGGTNWQLSFELRAILPIVELTAIVHWLGQIVYQCSYRHKCLRWDLTTIPFPAGACGGGADQWLVEEPGRGALGGAAAADVAHGDSAGADTHQLGVGDVTHQRRERGWEHLLAASGHVLRGVDARSHIPRLCARVGEPWF